MHREGHIGIGLLLYSPLAYLFVELGWMLLFGLGLVAIAVWSFLPDIDMGLPIRHRGPTHSIVAAVVAGVLTAAAFGYLALRSVLELAGLAPFVAAVVIISTGFVLGFVGVVGHIIGDVLTPTGIQPWWPRSNRRYSLNLVLAADEDANRRLSLLGAVALAVALTLAKFR